MNSKQRRKVLRAAEAEVLSAALTGDDYTRARARDVIDDSGLRPSVLRLVHLRSMRRHDRVIGLSKLKP